ncbi:hypothetical protein DPV78_003422 [Talaromyces pinophilus]|nr:hypothetical protein DPV78_003422 [Talaromyces pinophilus]
MSQRVVLLVTAPLGESFRSIIRSTGYHPPPSLQVDWERHENSALPDLAARLKFTTHYALCIIDREIWEDTSKSLLKKFQSAKFWDHPGDSTIMAPSTSSRSDFSMKPTSLNACRVWIDKDIKSIDSGEEVGRTNMSDEEISEVYAGLRQDWHYMPVFWNCHDLAIRLAHLIVPLSMDVVMFLQNLMDSLRQAYHREINWDSTAAKACVGGWGTAAIGAAVAVPPLAVAGGCIFMAGWSVGFFTPVVVWLKIRARAKLMLKLEERFPKLRSLHH